MNTIGIDVSKAKLDGSLKNTGLAMVEHHFVMKATGIYHQQLATFLADAGAKVSVVNPAQVKFYAQGLGVRSKNDKKDSVVSAGYGFKENPKVWQPEAPEIRTLKVLLARFDGIEKDLQREKNRQEKAVISLAPDEVINSLTLMIEQLESEQQRLDKLIEDHINKHDKLRENKALLESNPALGAAMRKLVQICFGVLKRQKPYQPQTT
ncbi:MAG: transposase [Methylococcales bacterium]|nr:transposase [Methylococcales bacterium]